MEPIRETFIDLQQERIINPTLINANRSVHNTVVDAMKRLANRSIEPIGYRVYEPTIDEIHEADMQEYSAKLKGRVDPSISLETSLFYAIDFYFCFNSDFASGTTTFYNTLGEWVKIKDNLSQTYNSEILNEIITTHGHNIRGFDAEVESLIHKITLFVPIAVNNAFFLLGDNRYYPKWYLRNKYYRNGDKLMVNHSSFFSHLIMKDGKIMNSRYRVVINPFEYVSDDKINRLEEIYSDLIRKLPDGKFQAIHETAIPLVETINDFFKNGGRHETESWIDIGDDIIDALRYYVTKQKRTTFALHVGLERYLNEKVDDYSRRIGRGKRNRKFQNIKSRGAIRPHIVMTTIKRNSHYDLPSGINDRDFSNLFKYSTVLDTMGADKKKIGRAKRQFRKQELGKVDGNSTSQSKNVGLSGLLCFAIDDVFLELRGDDYDDFN
jgi:hypothetical protein